jgi:hypothetical protein
MPKNTLLLSMLLPYHWISSRAVATSLAIGFSARICLPAVKACLMYSGWTGMGRAMMTAWMSERERSSESGLLSSE